MSEQTINLPASVDERVNRYIRRRRRLALINWTLRLAAVFLALLVVSLVLDQIVMLPGWLLRVVSASWLLPPVIWLIGIARLLAERGATAADLRRLDNPVDDLRAAINLSARLQAGDQELHAELVGVTVARAGTYATEALPSAAVERRRIRNRLLGLLAVVALALLTRSGAPDLHTSVRRLMAPGRDFGTVARRKFAVQCEVWRNAAARADDPAGEPAKVRDVFFQRQALVDGAWHDNYPAPQPLLADYVAGYEPLAMVADRLHVLAGDRLVWRFAVMDDRRQSHIAQLEALRLQDGRRIPQAFLEFADYGQLTMKHCDSPFAFALMAGQARTPQITVDVVPRPSPTRMYLFQRLPAHYGRRTIESVIIDADADINGGRLSGLPGSRLAVELQTRYGEDLDTRASYAELDNGKRLKLRYLTSRNEARRQAGEKFWTFDFVIDENFGADSSVSLHLVTETARFAEQPIDNRYDNPLSVHLLDDLPPSVELTQLPEQRHFRSDDILTIRYRYTDDYGIAELGIEAWARPRAHELTYEPLQIRPMPDRTEVRREDERVQIIDLRQYRYGYASLSLVVKDVRGQVAKTPPFTVTMSDHFTESMLPKLHGGWQWAWSHNIDHPHKYPADLDLSVNVDGFRDLHRGLKKVLAFAAGEDLDDKELNKLKGQLQYRHRPFVVPSSFSFQPFGYHHRDYPYALQRYGRLWMTGLAPTESCALIAARELIAAGTTAEQLTAARDGLQPWLPALREQLTWFDQMHQVRNRELASQVTLLRAAYFCELIATRVAEIGETIARLQQRVPAEPAGEASWDGYLDQLMTTAEDDNLGQEAKAVRLRLDTVNRKLAALREALGHLTGELSAGFDPRLVALANVLLSLGNDVNDLERPQLLRTCRLLSRFIRRGALADAQVVYDEVRDEFPGLAQRAAAARDRLTAARPLADALAVFRQRAAAVYDARLSQTMGEQRETADHSARWRRNQASRMRGRLELLEQQLQVLLFAPAAAKLQDLQTAKFQLRDLRARVAGVREWQADWPALAEHAEPLRALADSTDVLLPAVTAADALRRDLQLLSSFAPVLAAGGRDQLAQLAGRLAEQMSFAGDIAAAADADPGAAAKWPVIDETLASCVTALGALSGDVSKVATPSSPSQLAPLLASMMPAARLAHLQAELANCTEPEKQDRLWDAAAYYFANYPTDAGKDIGGNPVEEHLNCRAAAALFSRSTAFMTDFANTYAGTNRQDRARVEAHFGARGMELTAEVKAFIAAQDYVPPELPAQLQPLVRPYLEAATAGTLAAYLQQGREEMLAQLVALSRQSSALRQAEEARLRLQMLTAALSGLMGDVELHRLPVTDVRVESRWAEIQDQAESLIGDFAAGRLQVVPAAQRNAMANTVDVLRTAGFGEVLADAAALNQCREFLVVTRAAQDTLLPSSTELEGLLANDLPELKRQLAIVLVATFGEQTWFERQLIAERELKRQQLGNLSGMARMKASVPFGSAATAEHVTVNLNLVAAAWRSLCSFEAMAFARDPSDLRRQTLLRDLQTMLLVKALPEFYYDRFRGAQGKRRYAATNALDAFADQLAKSVRDGMAAMTQAAILMTDPEGADNDAVQTLLASLSLLPPLVQLERDLRELQPLLQQFAGTPARAAATAARARQSSGSYWRRLAVHLSAFVEAGEPMLHDPLPPDALRALLTAQGDALGRADRLLSLLRGGFTEAEQRELSVIDEVADFQRHALATVDDERARGEWLPTYADIDDSVRSWIQAMRSTMFPPTPEYPPRVRYQNPFHHFGEGDFESEVLAIEQRWFARADEVRRQVYDAFLAAVDQPTPQTTSVVPAAYLLYRYVDTKFRYLMSYGAKEPQADRPPPRLQVFGDAMPEHLARAYANAVSIDLPQQDNRLIRELYFETLEQARNTMTDDVEQ